MAKGTQHYPELLADIADYVAETLEKRGVPIQQAADDGFALAERIRKDWGKSLIYIPAGVKFDAAQRDLEIARRLGKENANDLAREFGISFVAVYAAARRVRAQGCHETRHPHR